MQFSIIRAAACCHTTRVSECWYGRDVSKRFLHTTLVPTHNMFLHHSVNVEIMARLTQDQRNQVIYWHVDCRDACNPYSSTPARPACGPYHHQESEATTVNAPRLVPPRNLNELRIALVSYWGKKFDIRYLRPKLWNLANQWGTWNKLGTGAIEHAIGGHTH